MQNELRIEKLYAPDGHAFKSNDQRGLGDDVALYANHDMLLMARNNIILDFRSMNGI